MGNKETKTGLVVIALLLGIFVASMDNTIVATAMATIVADLGGLKQFVWVTSAYMVAEMAGMPIFGKLSDMYGRKRFFLFGIIVFLLGSILCGMAQTIVQLSIFRAIQGIGGGALVPIAFTIMFDIFPPEKRGKMGGLFGAVFGLSSIFGPLLGAYITDYLNWRWVFYINIPLGIVAFLLLWMYYRESPRHAKQSIDWLGVMTLVPAIVCLMFALELGGQKYDWDSAVIIGLFSAFALLFLAFLYVETKAQEPIVSYRMFRERLFASTTLVAFFSGATFVVATVYIPIFIQGVTGGSATNSGLILLPMMLSTTVSAQLGGFLAGKTSYRNVMFGFMLLFAAGIGLLGTIDEQTTRLVVTLYMIIVGLGVGASFSVLGMAAIHHFSEAERGAASSTNSFVRSLGMTVGITVFGIIQRNLFTDQLAEQFHGMAQGAFGSSVHDPRAMLSPETRAHIPAPVLDRLTEALASSIADTFLWALIPAALTIVCVLLMSNDRLASWTGARERASEK
ncbi:MULTISPECIES: MDR family MFS transporter [Geobacillus]|uniref:MFS transporter n=1 Tax=Geobacillus thermocatenulatus TaxID=33938 RepID=A0A226QEN5_9BACL|nr:MULTISPECIES: MDR family MFS transporter [Geobacillus]ASS99190.1 MFS transporter [Geobacillus thermocatenulatus]KLR73356.1 major facilitator transporter [Geobacillus sp. T6]OXB89950.1 MFS transporter [Geobacillus thermocatenulatus]RAN23094.1 major facilitator transporter [Geobacillus sp. A8]